MTPGATSRARWMSKLIYSSKILKFNEQLHNRSPEIRSVQPKIGQHDLENFQLFMIWLTEIQREF